MIVIPEGTYLVVPPPFNPVTDKISLEIIEAVFKTNKDSTYILFT